MKEFEQFLRLFFTVQLAVFFFSFSAVILLKGWGNFTYSYLVGYCVMALDYFMLVRFAKRLPQQVLAGYFPKSGFAWRFLSVLLVLVGLSLFTPLNFFAIISAVVATNLALFLAVLLRQKEWRRWNI
jgi:hypothetical protein